MRKTNHDGEPAHNTGGRAGSSISRLGAAALRARARIGAFFNFMHELRRPKHPSRRSKRFIEEPAQTLNNIISIVFASIAARARRTAKNPRSALARVARKPAT